MHFSQERIRFQQILQQLIDLIQILEIPNALLISEQKVSDRNQSSEQ